MTCRENKEQEPLEEENVQSETLVESPVTCEVMTIEELEDEFDSLDTSDKLNYFGTLDFDDADIDELEPYYPGAGMEEYW